MKQRLAKGLLGMEDKRIEKASSLPGVNAWATQNVETGNSQA